MSSDKPSSLIREITNSMPIASERLALGERVTGLVIVDEVNGFASVGGGNLAPPVANDQVSKMVEETDRLARIFVANDWPILAFLDTHEPGKAEPPYPPHCEKGTGEEELVPELKWLEAEANTTLIRKDCINGFVGAIEPDGSNRMVDWVNEHSLERLLVVGICTDICVMDFVLTTLSARNHDMMPSCKDIYVYQNGCATYDLPLETAKAVGLPDTASHPQDVTHYLGLYFMASRGARLVDAVDA